MVGGDLIIVKPQNIRWKFCSEWEFIDEFVTCLYDARRLFTAPALVVMLAIFNFRLINQMWECELGKISHWLDQVVSTMCCNETFL